ncbi:MAG: transketolase [Oscillospiraceae bacterium]
MDGTSLHKKAYELRIDILEMVYKSKGGHIGGSMSCIDILAALYWEVMDAEQIKQKSDNRDFFVLSKGHCAEALYAVLASKGFFDRSELETYAQFDTKLAEHPSHRLQGVEISTGALGHGLSVCAGIALGKKRDGKNGTVYTLMGDGEQAEGSCWEAAISASKFKLDNLVAIVDRNRLQISGSTEEVMPLDNLAEKYRAFGFNVVECDGHSMDELTTALRTRKKDMPTVVIANTIKGCGSAIIENKAIWHHAIPNAEQYEQIKRDLNQKAGKVAE